MPEAIDPSFLAALALGSGLGLVLARLALRSNLLEERVRPSRCAAGRRLLEGDLACRCLE